MFLMSSCEQDRKREGTGMAWHGTEREDVRSRQNTWRLVAALILIASCSLPVIVCRCLPLLLACLLVEECSQHVIEKRERERKCGGR